MTEDMNWIQYPSSNANPMARPKTAGSWLVDTLRQAIIAGELPANSQVRQEEIAAKYDVSRMPVRQALDILAAEGWIEQRPHRGAFVAALDAEDALELFELREALEVLAAKRSFPHLSDMQRTAIERAWHALRAGEGNIFVLHQNLHLALYAAAGPRLRRLVMQQLDAVQRYLRFEQSALEVSEADNREHAQLVEAALAGDVERGVAILREHVAGGGRGIAQSLNAMGLSRKETNDKQ